MFKTPWAEPQSVEAGFTRKPSRGQGDSKTESCQTPADAAVTHALGSMSAALLPDNSTFTGLHNRVSLYGDLQISFHLHVQDFLALPVQ